MLWESAPALACYILGQPALLSGAIAAFMAILHYGNTDCAPGSAIIDAEAALDPLHSF